MSSPPPSDRIDLDLTSIGVYGLTVAGVIGVCLGSWLPWLVVEPGYTGPIPSIYASGMEAGIAGQDYSILGLTGIGVVTALVLSTRYRRQRLSGLVRSITGLFVVLLTLWWIGETTGTDGVYLDVYILGAGVYLTASGGVLLTIAGGLKLVTHRNRTSSRTPARS